MNILPITEIIERPGTGTGGRSIRLRSNFYRVSRLPVDNVYHYDLDIDPPLSQERRHKLLEAFYKQDQGKDLALKKPVLDGKRNLYASEPFALGNDQAKLFTIDLSGHPGFAASSKNTFQIRIKLVDVIEMGDLQRFLNGHAPLTTNCIKAIRVMDIVIRYLPSLTYCSYGRSIFTGTADRRSLSNGIEVWQGFYQSARPSLGRMLINVDTSNTAVYEGGPLPDIVAKMLNKSSLDELRQGIAARDLARLKKLLAGRRVHTTHLGHERNHTFQIHHLGQPANQVTFTDANNNNTVTTVSDYFTATHNRRLLYPFLPCIVKQNGTFLPMEICELVCGQRYNGNLNPKQTAEFIKVTCQPPQVRANRITQGVSLLQHKHNPYLAKFGIKIEQDMEVVSARVLNAPSVHFAQSDALVPQGGAWNLRAKKLVRPATLTSWSVVNFAGNIPVPAIQKFLRDMMQCWHELGITTQSRNPPICSADPQGNIEQTLKDAFLKAGHATQTRPQIIFCILPNAGRPLYAEIKRTTDTVLAIPSQCIQSKFIAGSSSNNKQYSANVGLKINMKLGGTNSHILPDEMAFISNRPTIIFGADVNHPAPGVHNAPSIAAVTASMDRNAAQFASTVRYQEGRVELIAELASMVQELLKVFYKKTGLKPQQILFYRDGVSESQFKQVLKSEVAAVQEACRRLEPSYSPTITFLTVQKRHHARFFPIDKQDADRNGNCEAGTVVDKQVVHPFEFDFFLQSHNAIKGTARPAHYHVIHDDHRFTADALQQLTYNLCYVYGRATRAVSIVPAAYYADLVAARARLHRKGGDWSDATSNEADLDAQRASYGVVPACLSETAYVM
ncbi:hypothetical protein MBANPS3_000450 [Mucor bainieri]